MRRHLVSSTSPPSPATMWEAASSTVLSRGKGAIAAYTRHLAVRQRGRPRANTVSPGFTLTPRSAPLINKPGTAFAEWVQRGPMQRAGYPHEIAEVVASCSRARFLRQR